MDADWYAIPNFNVLIKEYLMFDKHQIIVDKEKKTYTYTIEYYLTKEHSRNATVMPRADITSISREEFLELAYKGKGRT